MQSGVSKVEGGMRGVGESALKYGSGGRQWSLDLILDYFFFQAEDGIRDLVRSRGLGDVYKRQSVPWPSEYGVQVAMRCMPRDAVSSRPCGSCWPVCCLLYTSDAADDLLCVDLGGRRIIKKKTDLTTLYHTYIYITSSNTVSYTQLLLPHT